MSSILFNIFSNRSSLWYQTRKNHLIKQNYCQACGTKHKLQVHHIEPFHINPSKELDPNNLITLCKTCHFVFGHLMDYSSWNENVVNDARVYLFKVQNKPYKIYQQNKKLIIYMLLRYFKKLYE